jgi:zinc dependent phospholipase C
MRRLIPVALLTLAVGASFPAPVHAWGFSVHRFIADRAVVLLPPTLRPFFETYRTTFVEHAIDPDTYRTMGWQEEPPRHFLDMDAYGAFPFTSLPHDYNQAVAARGADFVIKNGLLPWRTEEMYGRLREAFKQTTPYARDDIKLFSAVVAHYIGDAFQPFHAAVNYDGQLTGQQGIHARFETEMFDRYADKLRIAPDPVQPVANVREFTFAALTDSFSLVEPILAADRAAVEGKEEYDEAYFDAMLEKTRPILEKRISQAITGVASVITAAWTDAGKPALPLEAPRAVRKVKNP